MNIQKLLETIGDKKSEFISEIRNLEVNDTTEVMKLKVTVVKNERENENQELVFNIDGTFFRCFGSYDSWEGTNFDYAEIEEVRPVEVKVIQYQSI